MSSVLSFLQEPSNVILQVLSCKILNEGLYVVEYNIRTSFRQAAVITAAFHYVFSARSAHNSTSRALTKLNSQRSYSQMSSETIEYTL